MTYNNKPVAEIGNFNCDTANVGDYVTAEAVEYFMNCLPPAYLTKDHLQLGEVYSVQKDPETEQMRNTFTTFKKVDEDVWKYCGHCFYREDTERGIKLNFINN